MKNYLNLVYDYKLVFIYFCLFFIFFVLGIALVAFLNVRIGWFFLILSSCVLTYLCFSYIFFLLKKNLINKLIDSNARYLCIRKKSNINIDENLYQYLKLTNLNNIEVMSDVLFKNIVDSINFSMYDSGSLENFPSVNVYCLITDEGKYFNNLVINNVADKINLYFDKKILINFFNDQSYFFSNSFDIFYYAKASIFLSISVNDVILEKISCYLIDRDSINFYEVKYSYSNLIFDFNVANYKEVFTNFLLLNKLENSSMNTIWMKHDGKLLLDGEDFFSGEVIDSNEYLNDVFLKAYENCIFEKNNQLIIWPNKDKNALMFFMLLFK